jgi:hypothetical protein
VRNEAFLKTYSRTKKMDAFFISPTSRDLLHFRFKLLVSLLWLNDLVGARMRIHLRYKLLELSYSSERVTIQRYSDSHNETELKLRDIVHIFCLTLSLLYIGFQVPQMYVPINQCNSFL